MPVEVRVNDFRWQFIAGDKYWVIGTLRFSGLYATGGVPLIFTRPVGELIAPSEALIKASRAPWFSMIPPSPHGIYFSYFSPSQVFDIDPPNTVGTAGSTDPTSPPTDVNNGLLRIFTASGAELPAGTDLSTSPAIPGLFIFQGME